MNDAGGGAARGQSKANPAPQERLSPFILQTEPLRVSPFDVNMALDAGFNCVVPYISVEERG